MSFVIQASPLTKVFLHREWSDKCINDPELIFSDAPFKVVIPRSMGAIVMTHNKPVAYQDILPKQPSRKTDIDETRDLIPWLTGGDNGRMFSETDIYGVVRVDIGFDYTTLLSNMLFLEAANKDEALPDDATDEQKAQLKQGATAIKARQEQMRKQAMAKIGDSLRASRERANERVLRACKATFFYLYRQYQRNIEAGMGKYEPSPSEALCAFVLKDELQKANAKKRHMMQAVQGVVNDAVGV